MSDNPNPNPNPNPPAPVVITPEEGETLKNALRFEQEKNQILVAEVVVLEDAMLNRDLADFAEIITPETTPFWREQLLTNRAAATVALGEMAKAKAPPAAPALRRPLHNRAIARPIVPAAPGVTPAGNQDDRAAQIRNRAHEIARADRIPFSVAFRRAEKEVGGK